METNAELVIIIKEIISNYKGIDQKLFDSVSTPFFKGVLPLFRAIEKAEKFLEGKEESKYHF